MSLSSTEYINIMLFSFSSDIALVLVNDLIGRYNPKFEALSVCDPPTIGSTAPS